MNENAQRFTESILKLAPKSAAFDCDGTIWDADSGMQFFYWLLDHHLVSAETEAWARPRYQQYLTDVRDAVKRAGKLFGSADVQYRSGHPLIPDVKFTQHGPTNDDWQPASWTVR